MMLGALVDAGAPLERIQSAVDALGVDPVRVTAEPVTRHGLGATRIHVDTAPDPVRRTWSELREILERAALPDRVRARALDVFERLARAEAAVHRVTPQEVHFHEVGALDAVADVVGTCTALEDLGVTAATGSAVPLGSGTTRGAHGVLPVPAPAVLTLLGAAGAPVHSGAAPVELCTPTGAALLAAVCTGWGGLPPMRVTATGYGAGSRDLPDVPNLLQVVLGEPTREATSEEALVLEANVDDLDPRLWPAVLARLLEAGAADAWLTPILMKKGRPAHTLSVLVPPQEADAVHRVIFTETSTIGVRTVRVDRRALARQTRTVTVEGHPVRVKTALLDGAVVNAQPEYDDVAEVAAKLGRPVKVVLAAANAAVHEHGLSP
jgi:uncharacterized protein (TIGR00299 family) protein